MSGGLFGALARKSGDISILDKLPSFLMSPESKSGITITPSSALQIATMFAAGRVIGEGVAQSSCRLMQHRVNRAGADRQATHALDFMLGRMPNETQTAFEFLETLVFHLLFVGNAFVFINRVGEGRIFELLIIEPGCVTVKQLRDKSLVYELSAPDGSRQTLTKQSIWHLRGPSWNGWMGMETIKIAREALGLSLALETGHAEMHKAGGALLGTYSVEDSLSAEQYEMLSGWVKSHFTGHRKGQPMIMDRGAKWLSQQMTGVDAEHLATRRFQIEEICRFARVMPIMVMQQDKTATYASAEQMFLQHIVHTIDPWTRRIAASADVALLTHAELKSGMYFEFNISAMMRGDYKSRQEGLQIQRRNGVVNANEWRDFEGMNPREDEGGDQYIVEGNMAVQDGRDLVPVSILKGVN